MDNKRKKMRKVVYYEIDTSSSPSTSDTSKSTSSKHHERKPVKTNFNQIPFVTLLAFLNILTYLRLH